ncbi:MAG: hypothetical protein K0S26_1152 [Bacteroidota bacterium]|jgi:hypothetical protein|nr:hypothetical protein [Bacteroidota bacterium]
MLVIEQYGVKLIRLQREDIEMVRYWRNQSDIANYMEYRNYITPGSQVKWFERINNKYNYYFVIEFESKKVGLINTRDYDPENGFGEGGIFIWDKNYINSHVAVFSTLCWLNFAFFYVKLSTRSVARILRNNSGAINYNQQIGYKLLEGQENYDNQLYELTLENYLKFGSKLNKAATQLNSETSELKYHGDVSDLNVEAINQLLIKLNP